MAKTRRQKATEISGTFTDITQLISPDMSVYPGEPQPKFEPLYTMEKDKVNVTKLTLGSHTGTHIDAPRHFLPGGDGIDRVPLCNFIGIAAILDMSRTGGEITGADLDAYSALVRPGDILLLYTGASGRQFGTDFSYLEPSAAQWAVDRGIKCIGIDSPSVEKYGSKKALRTRNCCPYNIGIIENLNSNLKEFAGRRMFLVCLPLFLEGVDAAPSRAILFDMLQ
ncbi:MAG: cyclase family protein [Nitrososphaera sp.]|uniref:cyclase family protein n=1 Tax=Nitrososphaera sp. TaxID=1971748 RepID=UPI003D6E6D05